MDVVFIRGYFVKININWTGRLSLSKHPTRLTKKGGQNSGRLPSENNDDKD